MKAPFSFGKIVQNNDFTNREIEVKHLVSNFSSSVNTILISPRRWGKSSLVLKAVAVLGKRNKKHRFCFIDLNNARTEEQFYLQLATMVLKSSSTKIDKILENAREFIGRFIPNLTFSPEPGSDMKLGLDWKEVKKSPDDIIDMAEKIAIANDFEFIICIDEFQNLSGFDESLEIQKKLRAHWQYHQNVTYCLYGSKRHMMMDVFTSPSMPFYKFGDIMFLDKILEEDWIRYIQKRFNETGKKIGKESAKLISVLTDCHPYYVQQLAQQAWLRSEIMCDNLSVHEAFEALVLQMSMLFQSLTDGLSNSQINFLKALINNEKQLSSQHVIQEYNLGTSANVVKIKKVLSNHEVIDIIGDNITFIDPIYKYWLGKYYYKIG